MNSKILTVVCFIKNDEVWFEETLESISEQREIIFNLLVIDGSHDPKYSNMNQLKIDNLKSRKKTNLNIVYHNIPDNHPCDAILNGINLCNTKYITFCSGNDRYLDNHWYSRAIKSLELDKNLSLIFGNIVQMDEYSKFTYQMFPELYTNQPPKDKFEFHIFCIATNFMFFELNYVVKTSVIKKLWRNKKYYLKNSINPVWMDHPSLRFAFDFHKERYLAEFYPFIVSIARDHVNTSRNQSQKDKNIFFQNLFLEDFKKLREQTKNLSEIKFLDSEGREILKEIKNLKEKISFYRKNYRLNFEANSFTFKKKIKQILFNVFSKK